MIKSTKPVMLIFAVAALLGAALHFLYHLLTILPFAVLAPVDESLFQHLKLLYWPVLLAALVLKKKEGQSVRPRLLGLLLSSALMLVVGWVYHITLGGSSLLFDITLYVLLMFFALLLFPALCRGEQTGKLWDAAVYLTVVLGVLLVLFTFFPPNHLLFYDLSGANTWSVLPC